MHANQSLAPTTPLLSEVERKRVLSTARLKLTLTVFVVAILLGLSAMIFAGVSRIFDWLTPSIRADLEHKAKRGALELAQTGQLGMLARETQDIARAANDYVHDPDLLAIVALDADHQPVFSYNRERFAFERLFAMTPNQVHDFNASYASWSPSAIEGVEVGRVALVVSKARLRAGMELRRQILVMGLVGCLVALCLCLLFVSFYIGPILQVTTRALARLEQTTEAALAAARHKSQFLANMSHEIRTPMNGIIGVLDLIHRTELTTKQQRYVQIIDASARGLLTIINDVLDFSKLEAGKYDLRNDEFDLRQVIQEVAELLSPKAHDKGLELVARVDPALPASVVGDTDRLKQVLNNLLGNAIKFTESGHVELRCTLEPASGDTLHLRFAVKDSGPGISEADQKRLFEVFSQVDGSLTRRHGGTGLGLAISRQLVQAMGGMIGVESKPGEGSTFWFTIATRAAQGAPRPVQSRDARVLVVCPSIIQREVVRELVESWGMTCTLTQDASEAAQHILEHSGGFDVVLLDGAADAHVDDNLTLLELCLGEGISVIHMLSTAQVAHSTEVDSQRSYLLKPLRASELYNGVIAVLEGHAVQAMGGASNQSELHAQVSSEHGTVLVVDDNEINRLVAVDLLTELGYASETACDGLEAVFKAERGTYAAILMDCQMPELDGYEATKRIRALPAPRAQVPIIALTAHALTGDRDRVLNAGMDDYISKPIRARTLASVLERWERSAAELRNRAPAVPAVNDNGGARPEVTEPGLSEAEALALPVLDELADVDDTLPRSKTIVELFLKIVPDLMATLSAAMAQNDTSEIRRLAHKLKGNCLSVGAPKLAAMSHAIEAAAKAGYVHTRAHEQLPELYARVVQLVDPSHAQRSAGGMSTGSRHG